MCVKVPICSHFFCHKILGSRGRVAEYSGFPGCVGVSLGEIGFWWRSHTSTDLKDLLFLLPSRNPSPCQ